MQAKELGEKARCGEMTQKSISAKPLFARLDATRGDLTRLADKLKTDVSRIANWRKRGIPFEMIDEVAPEIGLSFYEYLVEAELVPPHAAQDPAGYLTEAERELLDHYRRASLPWQRALRKLAKLEATGKQTRLREGVIATLDAAGDETPVAVKQPERRPRLPRRPVRHP